MIDPALPSLSNCQTPALVLDPEALTRNIGAMAAFARRHSIALRPHAKTHKSIRIAQLQIEAGAIGISCATVAELEIFADAGISGLLLTTPVADRPKLERLAALIAKTEVSIVVDHADQIATLRELLHDGSWRVNVLVDIDVGQRRTGVVDEASTIQLARLIGSEPAMRFAGIQGFAGHAQHIVAAEERQAAAATVRGILDRHRAALIQSEIDVPTVTGSGTGTSAFDVDSTFTELQVGSYVFMDADYAQLKGEAGFLLPYDPSLFILATVTSVNRPGEFTVDAGVKAMAFNGPTPNLIVGAPSGSSYRFAGDEHGVITLPPGTSSPPLGSRILMLTTHCDPTVNLHASYVVAHHNAENESWPVSARYGA